MSLIPLAALGRRYGVSVRGMESIIHLACIAHQIDYWQYGRTLEKLGIEHLSATELLHYVKNELNNKKQPSEVALGHRDARLEAPGLQIASGS
jgi:opine dehydrogenase